MKKVKEIKQRIMWAVFDCEGNIFIETISKFKATSIDYMMKYDGFLYYKWSQYPKEGYAVQKILVDIKILTQNEKSNK